MTIDPRVFRRSFFFLFLGGMLGAIYSALLIFNEPKVFKSEAVVKFNGEVFSKFSFGEPIPDELEVFTSRETFRTLEEILDEDSKWDDYSLYLVANYVTTERVKGKGLVKLTVVWSDRQMALELCEALPLACNLQLKERSEVILAERRFELEAWKKNRKEEVESNLATLSKICEQLDISKEEENPFLWGQSWGGISAEGADSDFSSYKETLDQAREQFRQSREDLVSMSESLKNIEVLSSEMSEYVSIRRLPELATKSEKVGGLYFRLFFGFWSGLRWSILPVLFIGYILHCKALAAVTKPKKGNSDTEDEPEGEDPW